MDLNLNTLRVTVNEPSNAGGVAVTMVVPPNDLAIRDLQLVGFKS